MGETGAKYPSRVEVMGILVDPFTMEQTVSKALDYANDRRFAHFVGVNADKYLQMKDNAEIDEIVRRCEVINADGASLVMASNVLGVYVPERVAGVDLMDELCAAAETEQIGVYLLGAKPEIVDACAQSLLTKYPDLPLVGYKDGYFSEDEYDAVGEDIKASGASIVFVGITSPKKEQVIEHFRNQGVNAVFLGVGGSFDVISGAIKRAPLWMRKAKVEWLYRMMQEPRRLVKRYLIGNARFLVSLMREKKVRR